MYMLGLWYNYISWNESYRILDISQDICNKLTKKKLKLSWEIGGTASSCSPNFRWGFAKFPNHSSGVAFHVRSVGRINPTGKVFSTETHPQKISKPWLGDWSVELEFRSLLGNFAVRLKI
jgi:hypothetical protein